MSPANNMNKTKEKILVEARKLFNEQGIADVSIRQIAKAAGISHGNLLYHFKSREEVVGALHGQLLHEAMTINEQLSQTDFDLLTSLQSTVQGFSIVYQYRFFFYDLLYISRTDPHMRATIQQVENMRLHMYKELILQSIRKGIMRDEEFASEYEGLIKRIRIFSDHWVTSAAIYNHGSEEVVIRSYARLLAEHFYPYLTSSGKEAMRNTGFFNQSETQFS